MLIEQAAYGNRWRRVSPAAKGTLALGGLIAAFAAPTPAAALLVAVLLAGVACLGARVAPALYGRAAAPAIGFLALSGLTLLVAIDADFSWRWAPEAWPRVASLTARSLAALAPCSAWC